MTVDVSSMWDLNNPAISEQRFQQALPAASPEEALILQTQIARTYGLRGDFTRALEILASIQAQALAASPEVKARYWLELGRTYCSATHTAESQTEQARAAARTAYQEAFNVAKASGLDNLAVDALHMLPMVETDLEAQLEWDMRALAFMEASSHPEAKQWEGALRNNLGYALHQASRLEEALEQFKLALAVREKAGDARAVRIAKWMIAWTYRSMGHLQEALDIQLQLEKEWEAAGKESLYVYEELEKLYRALDDEERAAYYTELLEKTRSK